MARWPDGPIPFTMPSMLTPDTEQSRAADVARAVTFSLVIPTLNEAANIERMVRALDGIFRESGYPGYEIVVVDDNSTDGTGQIADRLAAELPGHVQVIHRAGKASLGTAAVAGWQAARGDVLGLMDADFQHPPELIPRILEAIQNGADIAIGSRYTEGGGMSEQWNSVRKLISVSLTEFTRLLLGRALRKVRDPFSGCFAMRREVIHDQRLHPEGFKVLMEVLAAGNYKQVREVPYQFSARTAGESKLRLGVAIDDFLLLLRLAWQTRFRK
jgi:dolichol-phosphate mannosyltransferase